MTPFKELPKTGAIRLDNVTMPAVLTGGKGDLVRGALTLVDGRIADGPGPAGIAAVDMAGAMVLPCFTDMHTHIDKGHIWGRAPNPDGTFMGALTTVAGDREGRWSADDLRRRMDFSLRAAYAHGTRALRTHIDSIPPQDGISWPVFREMREEWKGRIDLQGVCLLGIDRVEADGDFMRIADTVAASGAVLGVVAYPLPDIDERLDIFFRAAAERGLAADMHVDETGDPAAMALRSIAEAVMRNSFDAPVVAGHCCSLSTQDEDTAARTIDRVAEAAIDVVSLPMCNMYLQDRGSRVTPRWRGVTLVHELRKRGVNVSFASDNSRDPFYAYGDMDMVEVMREATRIAHLDHGRTDWITAFTTTPSESCGFPVHMLRPGDPADLVILKARNWNELFARPQSERIVLRGGHPLEAALPDYQELDDLMEIS